MTAVAALTERMVLGALHDDLPFAILAPAILMPSESVRLPCPDWRVHVEV